jgi:anti-sigma factor RsiW
MDCGQLRTLYSDFADGQLDELTEIACHRHLAACEPCRRLHAAYRAGCQALRRQPRLTPSGDFGARLEARLAEDAGELAAAPAGLRQWTALAGAVTAVAVITVAGWMMLDAWPAPPGTTAATAGPAERPFVVRFAGDTSLDYPGPFTIIPVSRARQPRSEAAFEVTVDWMEP